MTEGPKNYVIESSILVKWVGTVNNHFTEVCVGIENVDYFSKSE